MADRRKKKHRKCFNIADGKICLTETQQKALRPVEEIGQGSRATVFSRADGKVVKFTTDGTDVHGLLEAQGKCLVPKVYSAVRLGKKTVKENEYTSAGRPKSSSRVPVYALVVERLRMLDNRKHRMQLHVLRSIGNLIEDGVPVTPATIDAICSSSKCKRFGELLLSNLQCLGRENINVELHGGNVGIDKHGRYKFLDLGEGHTDIGARDLTVLDRPPTRK